MYEVQPIYEQVYANDNDYYVMPFYIVCDVSGSMSGGPLASLQKVVPAIKSEMFNQPTLGDVLRISVIDFSDDAEVLVPMTNLMQTEVPVFSIKGGTSFAAAFKLLRQQIPKDIARLKASGQRVYRPAVFFLTDGGSTGWETAFKELTAYDDETGAGFRQYPLVVPMGIGDANKVTLQQLCWPRHVSRLYMARDSNNVAEAVNEMAKVMAATVVSTGNSSLEGKPRHELPTAEDLGDGVVISQYDGGDEM